MILRSEERYPAAQTECWRSRSTPARVLSCLCSQAEARVRSIMDMAPGRRRQDFFRRAYALRHLGLWLAVVVSFRLPRFVYRSSTTNGLHTGCRWIDADRGPLIRAGEAAGDALGLSWPE